MRNFFYIFKHLYAYMFISLHKKQNLLYNLKGNRRIFIKKWRKLENKRKYHPGWFFLEQKKKSFCVLQLHSKVPNSSSEESTFFSTSKCLFSAQTSARNYVTKKSKFQISKEFRTAVRIVKFFHEFHWKKNGISHKNLEV